MDCGTASGCKLAPSFRLADDTPMFKYIED
jgi:hypothetical protein